MTAGILSRRGAAPDEGFVQFLFVEHRGALLAYAQELTRDRMAAEDVVQEAFLRAWRHERKLSTGTGSLRGWLLKVVRNIVFDAARARRARPQEVAEPPLDLTTAPDHADLVVNTMVLADALGSLSVEYREVLERMYLHGYSVAETARALGIPSGTVKSRSHYALRTLRDLHAAGERREREGLAGRGGENSDPTGQR
ncbi:sigma-70 family RNA polymerase sigma factor [Micromonospora sp. WMMD1082]|uniref:sigma-70 family RNA polymerase sigma factor n=1 Tax=Micromonospora sp. WMMD1082 TaxID=3016104 RepID=UPI0024159C14|nr:sigma-70 family RNA polymerase sigma factor [Micromonospora sp. WMMD1082]MDG4795740.1 sigma-70 family RNA polymerase sigma factor [Micromonospora sp. WMMD1082]